MRGKHLKMNVVLCEEGESESTKIVAYSGIVKGPKIVLLFVS